jgi:hypothetical protein
MAVRPRLIFRFGLAQLDVNRSFVLPDLPCVPKLKNEVATGAPFALALSVTGRGDRNR